MKTPWMRNSEYLLDFSIVRNIDNFSDKLMNVNSCRLNIPQLTVNAIHRYDRNEIRKIIYDSLLMPS